MQLTSSCQASTVSVYSTSSTSFQLFPYHFSEMNVCKFDDIQKVSRLMLTLTCVFLRVSCLHPLSWLKNRTLLVSGANSHPLFTIISGADSASLSGGGKDFWWHFLNVPGHTRPCYDPGAMVTLSLMQHQAFSPPQLCRESRASSQWGGIFKF